MHRLRFDVSCEQSRMLQAASCSEIRESNLWQEVFTVRGIKVNSLSIKHTPTGAIERNPSCEDVPARSKLPADVP